MSTKEELSEARELIGLKVKEVSAVDRAANKRTFLVIKRREEDGMSIFDNDLGDEGFEIVKQEEEEEEEEEEGKKKAADDPAALTKTMMGFMKKAMTAAGVDKDEITKALEAMEKLTDSVSKAGHDDDEEEEKEEDKKKAKAEDDEEDDDGKPFGNKSKETKSEDQPILKINTDGSIELSSEITKGRVAGARSIKKVLQLFGHTAAILKEADPVTFKKALKALAKGDLPKDPGFPSQVRPTEPEVAKSVGDQITAAVTKAMAPVNEKLEKIEKTRGGSASLEDDGTTETNVKKSVGLFDGVLH